MAEGQGSGRGGGCSCGSEQLGIGSGRAQRRSTPWSSYGRSLAKRKIEEARAWCKAMEQEIEEEEQASGREGEKEEKK